MERVWEGGGTTGESLGRRLYYTRESLGRRLYYRRESLGRRLYYGRESGKEAVLWERVWEGG